MLEDFEGIEKISETLPKPEGITPSQTEYLAELGMEASDWDELNEAQQVATMSAVDGRMDELSIDVSQRSELGHSIFSDDFAKAYDDFILEYYGDGDEFNKQLEAPQDFIQIEQISDVLSNREELKCEDKTSIELPEKEIDETPFNELTKDERIALEERTGWSDTIIEAIRTKDEAEIYEKAGLIEGVVNGEPALLQPHIEGEAYNCKKWPYLSNKDLASEGHAPYDNNGRPYELHHIGQNPDSPLAELTYEQHHKNGNFAKLHTFEESKIDRVDFNKEREAYWEDRSNSL